MFQNVAAQKLFSKLSLKSESVLENTKAVQNIF